MKWIKLFEEFKKNNEAGDLITPEDIIKAKNDGQKIYATIIEEIPGNNPDEPLIIKDIDEDDLISVDYKGKTGYVKLKNVDKIGEEIRESVVNEIDLQSIIDSIPDSDIPSETNKILEIGDKIIYTEGWCDRCFSNYDVWDRDEMVELAKELTPGRLENIPKQPQYKRFRDKKLIDWKFIELDENNVNYALSIGIYK
jgi:hypothetical protein